MTRPAFFAEFGSACPLHSICCPGLQMAIGWLRHAGHDCRYPAGLILPVPPPMRITLKAPRLPVFPAFPPLAVLCSPAVPLVVTSVPVPAPVPLALCVPAPLPIVLIAASVVIV